MKKCRYFAIFSDLFRRTFLMQLNNYTSTPKSLHFKHKKNTYVRDNIYKYIYNKMAIFTVKILLFLFQLVPSKC